MYLQAVKNLQRQGIKELESRVEKIKSSVETELKSISDYPEIHAYFKEKFNKIDLSDIPIYSTSPRVMNRNGFKDAGGCYIDYVQSIFVKNRISIKNNGNSGRFATALYKLTSCTIDPEDVIIHELFHALSAKVRSGAGARFRNNEEEFVYTNCVDFYRSKGRSDEDIVKTSFLPFCIQDVMSDKKTMYKFWNEIGIDFPSPNNYSKSDYKKKVQRLFDNNASFMASAIVNAAKERAFTMIDLYNNYGHQQVHTNISPDDNPQLRMDTIDMDCDL